MEVFTEAGVGSARAQLETGPCSFDKHLIFRCVAEDLKLISDALFTARILRM
jgi:hypothetical protein